MYGSKGADRDPEAERKLREKQAAAAPDTPASPLHPPPLLTVLSRRRPPLLSDPPPLPFADGREAGSREGAPQGAEAREGGAAGGMGQAAGDRPFHSTMHRCDTVATPTMRSLVAQERWREGKLGGMTSRFSVAAGGFCRNSMAATNQRMSMGAASARNTARTARGSLVEHSRRLSAATLRELSPDGLRARRESVKGGLSRRLSSASPSRRRKGRKGRGGGASSRYSGRFVKGSAEANMAAQARVPASLIVCLCSHPPFQPTHHRWSNSLLAGGGGALPRDRDARAAPRARRDEGTRRPALIRPRAAVLHATSRCPAPRCAATQNRPFHRPWSQGAPR